MSFRKGITPVIATVLLLGITVAIGLTLYTQAQNILSGGGDTGQLDQVRNTEMQITPVYSNRTGANEQIVANVRNTGSVAINTSEFTMYFGPPNFQTPIPYDALPSSWTVSSNDNKCLTGGRLINPGESISCETGVSFPGALEKVEIQVKSNNFDKSWGVICQPQTSGARSC